MLVPVLPAVTHYHHYLSYGLVVIQSIYDPMPAVSGASPEPAALSCRPSAALSSDCGMLRAQSSLSAEYEPLKSLLRNEHTSGLRSAPVTEDWTNGRLSERVLQSYGHLPPLDFWLKHCHRKLELSSSESLGPPVPRQGSS